MNLYKYEEARPKEAMEFKEIYTVKKKIAPYEGDYLFFVLPRFNGQ
ncbi:hypothetical protein bcgnr5388_17810 [Bacillus cereus]